MKKKVTVIGASVGGLIAAAELSNSGFDVTVFEKGKTVGGLYNKVATPFGEQELGMHVLYVSNKQFEYLSEIFGADTFNVMRGTQVDIGASANFGEVFFNSHYPNVVGHELQDEILSQVKSSVGRNKQAHNATEEVINRFGEIAGREVISPILQKLWKTSPDLLTPHAIHCFFDLRRVIACSKLEANFLKSDPWIDNVLGNPVQSQPKGDVYNGRIGLTFKREHGDLSQSVSDWAARQGVNLQLEKTVSVEDGGLCIDGIPAEQGCDACIVAVPMHNSMATDVAGKLDQLDLSIYYFQLSEKLCGQFPAYYILAHSEQLKSSRIVNYDAYNQEALKDVLSVLSVEVLHEIGAAPLEQDISSEIAQLLPTLSVKESYRLGRSVKVCSPTLKNSKLLDSVCDNIERQFGSTPVYFSGMRTDMGIFFSHDTIGAAHESALECKQKLS